MASSLQMDVVPTPGASICRESVEGPGVVTESGAYEDSPCLIERGRSSRYRRMVRGGSARDPGDHDHRPGSGLRAGGRGGSARRELLRVPDGVTARGPTEGRPG
jgi:hypothetical protein